MEGGGQYFQAGQDGIVVADVAPHQMKDVLIGVGPPKMEDVLTGVGHHQINGEADNELQQSQDAEGQKFQKGTHSEGIKSQLAGSVGWNDIVPSKALGSIIQESGGKSRPQILPNYTAKMVKSSENLDSSTVNDRELLDKTVTSLEMLRLRFRQFSYQEARGPREAFGHLQELCCQWLKPESHTKEQILELVILEQFLAILPPEMQSWVRGDDPGSCAQAVSLAEDFLLWKGETEIQVCQVPGPLEKPNGGPQTEQRPADVQHTSCNGQGAENKKNSPDPEASEKMELLSVSFDGPMPKSREETDYKKSTYPGHERGEKLSQATEGNQILICHTFQQIMQKEKGSGSVNNCIKSFCQISDSFKHQNVPHEKALHQYTDNGKSSAPPAHQETIRMGVEPVVSGGIHLGEKVQLSDTHKILLGDQPPTCSECGHGFNQTSSLNGESFYICSNCGESFSSRSLPGKQERPSAQEKPPKNFRSDKEPPQFSDPQRGEKPYMCADCGKFFSFRSSLVRHQRLHTGDKPYKCLDCGKKFSQSSNLLNHQRIHTGEKPYSCPDCGRSFSNSSSLTSHERTHRGEKPYKCVSCGKNFSCNSVLRIHERIHTGEKPYECLDCGKSFSRREFLISHQRTHTGEKPYECLECGKSFSQRSNLINHQRSHTGEKPFECANCGKRFSHKASLLKHEKKHVHGPKIQRDSPIIQATLHMAEST